MENKTINLAVVAEVGRALQDLNKQIVFVGGAVVSLYTDDPAADEVRPTGDVEAFLDRGNDYLTSHDIEDIIYIIDNRTNIVSEVIECQSEIRLFIAQQFEHIMNVEMLDEVLMAHIHPIMLGEGMSLVKEKIELIVKI